LWPNVLLNSAIAGVKNCTGNDAPPPVTSSAFAIDALERTLAAVIITATKRFERLFMISPFGLMTISQRDSTSPQLTERHNQKTNRQRRGKQ
jgi:hypothetical protein